MGPGGHDESGIDPPYAVVEHFQNLGRGSGAGPIIDDEEYIPGVIEELQEGGAFGGVFQGPE
jgi:hypothetical protein